jgi:tripartite-type tricarboxylate transporter receptor subunit TctC
LTTLLGAARCAGQGWIRAAWLAGIVALGFAPQAHAQFPDKPVRLIVPQAPGSATDVLARLLVAELGPILKQTVVIENKPGAVFTLGLSEVAKAAPDGYTLGMGPIASLAMSPHMVAKLPYDILRDFQAVGMVTRGQLVLAVSPKSPIQSVQALIAEAKKNPGKLSNASAGNGSPGHITGELFKFMTGTDIVHVPYRGGQLAVNDLLGGHVHLIFESLNSVLPHARSGEVKALAVTGPRRSPALPDLPTVAEAGVPGFDVTTWQGVVGPAGMPREVVATLNTAINTAIQSPAFKERFGKIGDEPADGPPEAFADAIRKDHAKWGEVIKRSGIRMQ